MDKAVRHQLNELKHVVPNDQWKASAKHQLLQQVEGSARHGSAAGWLVVTQETVALWLSAAARPAYALAGMAVIMLVGGLFSISAASEATPGSVLYTVKLVGEKTQFAFARQPEEKVRLHAVLAERRAQELAAVAASDTKQVTAVAAHLIKEIDEIKTKLSEIEREQPQAALAVAREVEEQTRQLRAQLESTKQTVASDAQETTDTLDEAIASVGKTELAALKAIAAAQPANEEEKKAVDREVGDKVANKIAEAKEKVAATEEEIDAVVSAGLTRTEQNIQTSSSLTAKSKTQAATQALAEAEVLLQQENFSEALDKLSESENLLNEAEAAQAQAANAETNATTTPEAAATTSPSGAVEGEQAGAGETTTTSPPVE